MMKYLKPLLSLVMAISLSCTTFAKEPQSWFDAHPEQLKGVAMRPAVSVDMAKLSDHYNKHPARWNKLFETLRTSDLKTLPLGLVVLNDNLKMNVQEYTTRPTVGKKLLYEKHEKFIDVQCVVTGAELQGKGCVKSAKVFRPYNAERDIAMYNCADVPFYIVESGMFAIFFPDEVHTTNYGFGERSSVRKIVFKVRY